MTTISYSLFAAAPNENTPQTHSTLLDKRVALLLKKIELLEAEQTANNSRLQNLQKQLRLLQQTQSNVTPKLDAQTHEAKVYATVRPTYGYTDSKESNNWDVKDALSHAGFKVTTQFKPDWNAIMHGEWGIDLGNNGDFGKARQVYVALDTPYGYLGIGKQRPAQYLFIAEYVDLFDHGSSPFSYDPESLFFVNNFVSYKYKFDHFTFMAGGQYDGEAGDKQQDLVNIGFSYDHLGWHAAATYVDQKVANNGVKQGEDVIWAGSLAYQFENGLYLAASFQDKQYKRAPLNLADRSGHTFDLSAAYQLSEHYKLKSGVFDFSDGKGADTTQDFNGYNITLEWLPASNLRFHVEYLDLDYQTQPDRYSVTIGFRYDFAKSWSVMQ